MTRPLVILLLSLIVVWPLAAMEPPPNLDSALDAQRELVRNEPQNPVAQNDLGNLLALAGRSAEAENAYQRAIELSPADPAPRFNLALLYQETGRPQLAQDEFEALLAIKPDHAWAHYQLGVLLAKKSREKALDHYAKALALDPGLSFASNNPQILDNPLFGEALLRSQRYREKSAAATVPRQYGEAQRIIDLMVPREEATAQTGPQTEEEAAEAPEGEAKETGAAGEGTSGEEKHGRPVAAAPGSTESSPGSVLQPTRSQTAPTRSVATPPSRRPVAGRHSQKPSSSYTTIGTPGTRPDGRKPPEERAAADAAGVVVGQPTSGRRLQPSPPPTRQDAASRPSRGNQPDPPRSRYIPPSRRSTAQLDLKLLPEEPAEKSG